MIQTEQDGQQYTVRFEQAHGDIDPHAACSASKAEKSIGLPAAFAISEIAGRLHEGMRPLVFQLETVDGVSARADATALVPPSSSMISVAVCICENYDIRKSEASR